jgi:hypothetical protein
MSVPGILNNIGKRGEIIMISFFTGWSIRVGTLVLGIFLGWLVVACAAVKPADLKSAEVAVERVQSDPEVNRYAPVARDEAEELYSGRRRLGKEIGILRK